MEMTLSLWLLLVAGNVMILSCSLYFGVFWRRRGQVKGKKKELVIVNYRPPPPPPFICPEIFLYQKVKEEEDESSSEVKKTPIGGPTCFPFQRMLRRDKRRGSATVVSTRAAAINTPSPKSTRNSISKDQKEALAKLVKQVKSLKVEKEALKTDLEKSLKQNEKQEKLIQDLQDKIDQLLQKEVNCLSTEGDSGKAYVPTAIVDSEEQKREEQKREEQKREEQKREEMREKIVAKQRELTARVCKGLNMGRVARKEVQENTDLFREVNAQKLMLQQKVDFLANKSLLQDMYIVDLLEIICELVEPRVTPAAPYAALLADSACPSTRSPRRRPLPTAGNLRMSPPPRDPVSQSGNTSPTAPMISGGNIRARKKTSLLKTLEAKTLKMEPHNREKQSAPIE